MLSVIIRVCDEAANLERCLRLIAAQHTAENPVEVIVVDSGSRDGGVGVARSLGARVIELPVTEFTYGGALNLGAGEARGDVLVALSAHAFPPDGWLARIRDVFADPAVACASGDSWDPEGFPLTTPIRQDAALAARRPEWGYANAAGAFRAELWRRRGFREDLPGCEDKEWAWHWLAEGYVCVVDPALVVDHDHTHDRVLSIYLRARREAEAFASFLPPVPYGARDLVGDWWRDLRWYRSATRARLSHRRAARLLGTYAGRRSTRT